MALTCKPKGTWGMGYVFPIIIFLFFPNILVDWLNAYSPPTPADLNAEPQIENLLLNPLYECFMINFLNLHEIHKEEKGSKHKRQQRIINGKIDIQVHNLLVSPPLMENTEGEFTFTVFVKREAECLKNVKKLEKGSGKEKMYVEGEVELQSTTYVQPIRSEIEGSPDGCQWMISTGEYVPAYVLCMIKIFMKGRSGGTPLPPPPPHPIHQERLSGFLPHPIQVKIFSIPLLHPPPPKKKTEFPHFSFTFNRIS